MKKLNSAIIAAILFIALISTQFNYGQTGNRGMGQGNHYKMMQEKLNLTDTQSEAVEELHFSHKREMIDLKAALEQVKLDKNELLSKGNYTRDDYLNKVKAISDAKEIMVLAKSNHRMDVYDLLTEEQRKTFNEIKCCQGKGRQTGRMRFRQMRDLH
ncbi:Spy/CpxP family protein refolding chaperone [Bacteroidota bacterium]